MAFATVSTGDQIVPKLATLLPQLATALTERQSVLGQTLSTFPSISGQPITLGATYISTLRSGIAGLVGEGNDVFIKSDYTTYTETSLLSDAGYGSWDTNYIVSNKAIWQQFIDVFNKLKLYRRNIVPSEAYAAGSGWRTMLLESVTDREDAWDKLKAKTLSTPPSETSLMWSMTMITSTLASGTIRETESELTYDFSGCVGTFQKLTIPFSGTIGKTPSGTSVQIDHSSAAGSGTIATLNEDDGNFSQTLTLNSGVPTDASFLLTYSNATSPPADVGARDLLGFVCSYDHAEPNYWVDITSALTYG